MKYVPFGNTGMNVSRLALGTMTFGSALERGAVGRVVDEAIDNGVNLIDTADTYGDSEEILGEVLSKEKRERVYLATKVFGRYCRDGRVGRNSRVNIIQACERSLRLLRTDYVDLYQLHHPDNETPIQETLSALDGLVKQGKIRYYGVSNHYAWQMAYMLGLSRAYRWEPLVSVQSHYNILDRQIEVEVAPFCRRFNIAVMCWGPLCGGLLTGKYVQPDELPEGSRGEKHPRMQAYLRDETVQRALDGFRAVATESGFAMNQAAILWLMAKPYVTTILLGGSRPEHFTQMYEIADRELPEALVRQIDDLSATRVHTPFANQPFVDAPASGLQW